MPTRVKAPERKGFGLLKQKLASLGADDQAVDDVLKRIIVAVEVKRSEDIVAPDNRPRHSTVLLDGVACLYDRLADGSRQIFAFQYPGDFCGLNVHVVPGSRNDAAVAALTACSVGTLRHSDLDELILRHPSLGSALLRASMLEASMLRQRLLSIGRQPALQRVAHLVCEQMARRELVGIRSAVIPLRQSEMADAIGLSIVHISRTFTELQQLGMVVKEGRSMKVVDKSGLAAIAGFDGSYLNMPQLLSRWAVEQEALQPSRSLSRLERRRKA